MSLRPGSLLGPYEVVGTIGAGGFATVYRARDPRLEDDVAIKVLAENHCLDPNVRERFIGEGQMLRRAAGAHVLEVHDIGQTESGQPFLVLEYAARGDLRQRVEQRIAAGSAPSTTDIVTVVAAVSSGLSDLHRHGVVHRDLSPANLLICGNAPMIHSAPQALLADDERIVLADLGFAKDLAASSGLTVGGGTRGFDAPEQRVAASKVDQRADIYGATLLIVWLMLGGTAQPPRDERALEEALDQLRTSAALETVILRGAAALPDDRFGTIVEWRDAMQEALLPAPPVGVSPIAVSSPTRVPDTSSAPRRRWKLKALALVATAILSATLTIIGMRTLGTDDGDATPAARSRVDAGTVRTARQLGDLEVAVFGPTEIAVGETAVFEAGLKGIADYRWIGPDGVLQPDQESLTLVGGLEGMSMVTLVGTASDGRVLATQHRFDVVAENS